MKIYIRNIFFSVLVCFFTSSCFDISRDISIKKGILYLKEIDLSADTIFALDGEWEFYWKEFINPGQKFLETETHKHYLNLPGVWNNYNLDGTLLGAHGYSSFHLKIFTKPTTLTLGFKIPDMGHSYTLYFNGEKICSNGNPGKTEEEDIPQVRPVFCFHSYSGDTIDLVLHVSNFRIKSSGVKRSIWMGDAKKIQEVQAKIMLPEIVFLGAAFIMCLYHLELYFFRRKDIPSLYLGIICFLLVIRILVSGEKYLFQFFPSISWSIQLHMEYLNVYLLLPAFSIYQYSIFPLEFKKFPLKIILTCSFILVGFVLCTSPRVFNYTMEFFEGIVILSSFYAFHVIFKVMEIKKREAFQFLLSFTPLFLGVANEILYDNFYLSVFLLTPIAWILFLLFQSIFISRKSAFTTLEIETLSGDLYSMNQSFKRFVPAEFLTILGRDRLIDVRLGDQIQKEMSVMFADIRSFTEISEKMKPDESFNFINNYLKRMGPIIRQNNGFIDKFIGDAIMALFPLGPDDAILAAIQMQAEVRQMNGNKEELPPIKIGIGIHTGELMLGIVGENERMEGTVIADAVNLASRLEGLTKVYGSSILISHQTFYNLNNIDDYDFRILDKVKVKGKNESVTVIEILNGRSSASIEMILGAKLEFERGVAAYLTKDFSRALTIFKILLEQNPDDLAMKLYLERSLHYASHGVPLDWEGVANM